MVYRIAVVLLLILINTYGYAQQIKAKNLIVITDLYHPYQDPGDNLDLIMGFALPQVKLQAVILDITDAFRKKIADHPTLWKDPRGPREAGIIPVMQLNYIFDRNVPYAIGPLTMMRSESDIMKDSPEFEQEGIELFLKTLKESKDPVEILSFGSSRILAVAYNREPRLCRKKIARIHLSAGTAAPDFKQGKDEGANSIPGGEWNVALDVFAFTRILKSGLPIALYPCAGIDGGFVKDPNNTYWKLPSLSFLHKIDPPLQRYLDYAFSKELRHDFLKAMDVTGESFKLRLDQYPQPFHFWETALWMNALGMDLVRRSNNNHELILKTQIKPDDSIVKAEMVPCVLTIRPDGRFTFTAADKSNISIFYRSDPEHYEKALQEAYPRLLISLSTTNKGIKSSE